MDQPIVTHLPLITNRIEFLEVRSQAPFIYAPTLITPRINFGQGQGPILPIVPYDSNPLPSLEYHRKTQHRRRVSAACYVGNRNHDEEMPMEEFKMEEREDITHINAKKPNYARKNNGLRSDSNNGSESDVTPGIADPPDDTDTGLSVDVTATFRVPKIPKPQGEPGRPGYGGYTLAAELQGWTAEDYTEINKFVKATAKTILNTRLSYNKQTEDKLAQVCDKAKKHFPILNKYEAQWPVRDLLKLHLKYTSEQYRKGAHTQGKKNH